MITSGIAADKALQKQSLANHDPDIVPHVIEL